MHIHILGICGTFMGSLAQLAQSLGHQVTGSDVNVYPPMSTQLAAAGITLIKGFDPQQLSPAPDQIVVGNALSRGNPVVEAMLDSDIPFISGPQWLREQVLQDKWVLAVAGTHGKTTTSCMLAWVLEFAGMAPGYLIGGVPKNFDVSARLGNSSFFVVEADEYDTAFFDKRSKFVHYRPRTLILNNLEFDHADIFPDLAAIQTQFHHLVRIVPRNGLIVSPLHDAALNEVLQRGCWTPCETLGIGTAGKRRTDNDSATWEARLESPDGSHFALLFEGRERGRVRWSQTGLHNIYNALAAAAAARNVGVTPEVTVQALNQFGGVKRRMECIGQINNISVYDDFAHHPTAIKTTLSGLRAKVGREKIIALIEPRSNTMRLGIHKRELGEACVDADHVLWFQPPTMNWTLGDVVSHSPVPAKLVNDIDRLIDDVLSLSEPGTHIVIMSNGGFGGLQQRLLQRMHTVTSQGE